MQILSEPNLHMKVSKNFSLWEVLTLNFMVWACKSDIYICQSQLLWAEGNEFT